MVSCYAPLTGRSQIEKEGLWRQVEGVIMNTDINQEVIVGRDMNGHVGEVANGFHEARGNFGYGTRNPEGERILVNLVTYESGEQDSCRHNSHKERT